MPLSSFWKDKNVFITGCTGLLGSWLTKRLAEEKARVVGLVRDFVPKSNLFLTDTHKKIHIVHGDVAEYKIVERTIAEYEIDTVFHLAAQTIVGIANRSPLSTFESNIKGTWNVLEVARNCKTLKRIIVASSDKAYGKHKKLPYDENMPLRGMHPYDVSKSCADLLAQAYYHTYRLPIAIARCSNLYGGGDLNFNRIVPGTIYSLLNDEAPIIRSDGTFVRDYFYVLDAVDAYLLLASRLDDASFHGEIFNFGTEKPLSVLELTNLIIRLMGKINIEPIILNEVKDEIKEQYLTCKKAKEMLSWKPKFSLEEGLKETIIWYKNYFSPNSQNTVEKL